MSVVDPSAPLTEDKELVLAFQRGQSDAYRAIHERHQARVQNVCRRMLMDAGDAQEAAQETFLRVYEALGRFNGRYQLGAWITRIATNVCLDQLRARSRRPQSVTQIEELELAGATEVDELDPEVVVIQRAETRRVRQVLRQLPPLHRAAIVLRDFEGLSYAEIARSLDVSEAQVKALLHRARQRFKRSWIESVASIFVPARLLQRLRGMETAALEPVAHTSASSGPVVASCTTALQQCGQVIAEKVGPAAAAFMLGVTGGAVATTAAARSEPRVEFVETTAPRSNEFSPSISKGRVDGRSDPRKAEGTQADDPAVGPTPIASPTPSPETTVSPVSPSPTPSAEPSPTEQGPRDGGGSSPPPPPPTIASLGFTHGAINDSSVTHHSLTVDCGRYLVDQRMSASFSDNGTTYPATLDLDSNESSFDFQLLLYPDGPRGMDVEYDADGQLVTSFREGSRLDLNYSGTYSSVDGSDAARRGLPTEGTFTAEIRLDCDAGSVLTETLHLAS